MEIGALREAGMVLAGLSRESFEPRIQFTTWKHRQFDGIPSCRGSSISFVASSPIGSGDDTAAPPFLSVVPHLAIGYSAYQVGSLSPSGHLAA